jgi:predicted AAA+ superfamily ATPase
MKLMVRRLLTNGVADGQIIEINFESMNFRGMNAEALYQYVKARLPANRRVYLFFDEIQRIDRWQDAVNSFRVDFDCDIYVTGSNAFLLSSEYATYLAGRSVEIKMLPLSFREFLDFHGYTVKESKSPSGGIRRRIYNAVGEDFEPKELLDAYIRFGGMPGIADVGLDIEKATVLLDGVYSTVVVRDILEREKRRGQRQITDSQLLRKIIMFLADNIGGNTSITSIGSTLMNGKLFDGRARKGRPAVQTIQAYVGALLESYVFYEIKRFDIKGKEYLRTLGKYYIVDIGLRNYLLGFRDMDTGHIIENIVYFELLRRGYDIAIGKIGDKEVDFIVTNASEKRYIQVTEAMYDPAVRDREFTPLRNIRDNYEKIIIAGDCDRSMARDGIKAVKLTDFLLDTQGG